MRRSLALTLAVPFFGSLFACTAILGNYTVGTTQTDAGTDGAGDVVQPDGNGTDGAPDAAPPQPMTCDVNGSAVTITTDTTFQDRMWIHSLPGGNQRAFRLMIMQNGGNGNAVTAYTLDDKLGAPAKDLITFGANVNILGVTSYDGGYIVLAIDYANQNALKAIRYDDTAGAPSTPFNVISTLPANINSDVGYSLVPINESLNKHDFFFAFSYLVGANQWQLDTHAIVLDGSNPLPTEPVTTVLTTRPDLHGSSILLDKGGQQAFVLMGADKGVGDLQIIQTDFGAKLLKGPTTIKGPSGAFFIPMLGTPATGPDNLNAAAIFQGDLSNQNIPLGMRAGTIDGSKLGAGWDPNNLPPLVVMSPAELAVDKSNPFWQFFAVQGPQYVCAARATNSGKGVNLNWFDGAGRLRALRGGPTALFQTDVVQGAAGALVDAPNAVASNLVVTWLTDKSELKAAKIGCLK